MMRVPGRKILRRALRPVRRRFFPGAVVLGYHRVADDPWDPLCLQVRSRHFTEQVDALKALRRVISLGELVERQADGEPLERYAVLTFDDGYQDFAQTVVPAARQAEVPVTVFVATGCTGGAFWWEELAALLAPGVRGRTVLEVDFGEKGKLQFQDLERQESRRWAVNAISERLSRAESADIEAVLAQVRAWVGPDQAPPSCGAPMTEAELAEVARHSHVEVGAHTISHCYLEGLGPSRQRAEIAGSKEALESLCGRPVTVFSYPNGSWAAATPGIVRDSGFDCACGSAEGIFTRRGDPYMIPRIWVPDIPGKDFRQWLSGWVAEAGR